jgi:hypothetical protein
MQDLYNWVLKSIGKFDITMDHPGLEAIMTSDNIGLFQHSDYEEQLFLHYSCPAGSKTGTDATNLLNTFCQRYALEQRVTSCKRRYLPSGPSPF